MDSSNQGATLSLYIVSLLFLPFRACKQYLSTFFVPFDFDASSHVTAAFWKHLWNHQTFSFPG